MKAVQINAYGGNEVLEIKTDAPKPPLATGQVLVEVYAAGLNPVDNAIRAGYFKEMVPVIFPATLGGDFSGIVVEVGNTDTDFKAGDQVYGQAVLMNGGSGSLAQFVASNAANMASKPENLSHIEAAAVPLAGASALQALEDHIKLKSGQKILIHGGTGGIGTFAIQIAKSLGAYVATTVRADDSAYVRDLGADQMIDYQTEAFEKIIKDFDAVFDTAGGETTNKSFQVLKKGGILVSMAGKPNQELAEKYGITAIGQSTVTDTRHLNRLTNLLDKGQIKVHLDKVFSLELIQEAFKYLTQEHLRGKIVVKIDA